MPRLAPVTSARLPSSLSEMRIVVTELSMPSPSD
jgi:hypothetical protein